MRNKFESSRATEKRYGRALRTLAKQIGIIVARHVVDGALTDERGLTRALSAYSGLIEIWAGRQAASFLGDIDKQNEQDWRAQSKKISRALKSQVATTTLGVTVKKLQADQVTLIKSLPLEAGKRAQALAREAATGGRRASEVATELLRTEEVTASRATLIARTEIAKATAMLTQARAGIVGAESYIWRTAGDGDVRDSHAEMEGKVIRWDTPPTLSDGYTHHAGQIFNCRCYSEPIVE